MEESVPLARKSYALLRNVPTMPSKGEYAMHMGPGAKDVALKAVAADLKLEDSAFRTVPSISSKDAV